MFLVFFLSGRWLNRNPVRFESYFSGALESPPLIAARKKGAYVLPHDTELPLNACRPGGGRKKKKKWRKRKKDCLFAPRTDCLIRPPPSIPPSLTPSLHPCVAGLRPRGDEPDQSDQSTEITVIPEVSARAPGHSEFTHPTHKLHAKSVQEWQTCVSRAATQKPATLYPQTHELQKKKLPADFQHITFFKKAFRRGSGVIKNAPVNSLIGAFFF